MSDSNEKTLNEKIEDAAKMAATLATTAVAFIGLVSSFKKK